MTTQFDEMKTNLIKIIAKQQHICMTCDIWSSRAQAFMGMTLHFLTSNFSRVSCVLAFRDMPGRQTNKEITDLILQVFKEFDIPIDKVTHIVTDGGSAFCKAFKLYGKSVDTLVEASQNIDDMCEAPFIQYEDGECFFSNIINFENESNADLEFDNSYEYQDNIDDLNLSNETALIDEVEYDENDENREHTNQTENNVAPKLPPHRRCLSHISNLVGPDFEKELSGRAKSILKNTLEKLQAIWVFPRKSSYAKTLSKQVLGGCLIIPCETRWNSKYDAVNRILSLQSKINEYVTALKTHIPSAQHLQTLEKEDWTIISMYVKVMSPVAAALDILQGEKDCSQGFILPTLFSMKHRKQSIDGGPVLKTFRDTMLKVIDRRFEMYFKFTDTHTKMYFFFQ